MPQTATASEAAPPAETTEDGFPSGEPTAEAALPRLTLRNPPAAPPSPEAAPPSQPAGRPRRRRQAAAGSAEEARPVRRRRRNAEAATEAGAPREGGARPDGRRRGPKDGRRHGRETGRGKGRDGPRKPPEQKLYSLESVVDRGFEDVADEAVDSGTRRVHWTILKRTVADQKSARGLSAVYILRRDDADTEFPNLGAARTAANKTIVHPEKLTMSKAEHAAARQDGKK